MEGVRFFEVSHQSFVLIPWKFQFRRKSRTELRFDSLEVTFFKALEIRFHRLEIPILKEVSRRFVRLQMDRQKDRQRERQIDRQTGDGRRWQVMAGYGR